MRQSDAVEQAELRASLAAAGEQAAELRARDARIAALEQRVADLNAQLTQARSDVDNVRLDYEALLELRLAEVRRTRDAARPVS